MLILLLVTPDSEFDLETSLPFNLNQVVCFSNYFNHVSSSQIQDT